MTCAIYRVFAYNEVLIMVCFPLSATGDDENEEEEAKLLRDKMIPYLERELRETRQRLEQLENKSSRLTQETEPPRNGASSLPAS